jgi:hypothetical protein
MRLQLPRLNDDVERGAFRWLAHGACPEIPRSFLWQARPEMPRRFAAYIRFLSQIRITNSTLQIETLSQPSPSRG